METDQEKHKVWLKSVVEELESDAVNSVDTTMFRVPQKLKAAQRSSYQPRLISLGLYGREFQEFQHMSGMDKYRVEMTRSVLKKGGISFSDLCNKVVDDPDNVKQRYDEFPNFDNDVVKALLTLDAFFLLGYLHCCVSDIKHPIWNMTGKFFRDIFSQRSYECQDFALWLDINLYENQIPLFLLTKAYRILLLDLCPRIEANMKVAIGWEQTPPAADEVVYGMIRGAISLHGESTPGHVSNDAVLKTSFQDCRHLLQCLYKVVCYPQEDPTESDSVEPTNITGTRSKILTKVLKMMIFPCTRGPWKRERGGGQFLRQTVPQMSHIQKVGIKVKTEFESGVQIKSESIRGRAVRISYMRFDQTTATLYLPKIGVFHDNTGPLLRNLATYEHSVEAKTAIIEYLYLMDYLVDSENDVQLLSECGLITAYLGSDKDVATMWNEMLHGFIWSGSTRNWEKLVEGIISYCENDLHALYAEFVDLYFGKPWLTFSFIAAGILLILTLLQTVFDLISYFKTFG